jgi:hypothetical protein
VYQEKQEKHAELRPYKPHLAPLEGEVVVVDGTNIETQYWGHE